MHSDIERQIRQKIDNKTKPAGALGMLEVLAFQIASLQNTLEPKLTAPHIVVFAGSHGIAGEGVSAFPSGVTAQMVLNFLGGGAAINVFANQHDIELVIVDAGVDHSFAANEKLVNAKVGFGTKSFLRAPAMTMEACRICFEKGAEIVGSIAASGSNVIGFGEMGIGNTSSAAAIMSILLGLDLEECAGKGTGLEDHQLQKKIAVLQEAINFHHKIARDPLTVLHTFGGFEIAMMCGAMQEAARQHMLILVDGFIASAAFLCAYQLDNTIMKNAVFCHQSDEKGHRILLEKLNVRPILNLGMRLGEGTGCAVAYPILQSAVAFMNEMASFESAGVSRKSI